MLGAVLQAISGNTDAANKQSVQNAKLHLEHMKRIIGLDLAGMEGGSVVMSSSTTPYQSHIPTYQSQSVVFKVPFFGTVSAQKVEEQSDAATVDTDEKSTTSAGKRIQTMLGMSRCTHEQHQ